MREAIEEAFWNFVDQKWRDALNVAAAETPAWGTGGGRATPQDGTKKEAAKPAKAGAAAMHVTGVDGKRHRQGDSGQTCVFKDVMGCIAAHPPWLYKVFGRLPAGERERLIKDNWLCPFCLLHDKDKPCGAKQRPVPVKCTTPSCKGRHIQKLHDFLKDVFREENQVHVVHGDDGWEESEEAWESGEEEMMIVGTVQQEEDCIWQDACRPWMEQDEEIVAGVYQVGTCQKAVEQSTVSQCKNANSMELDEKASEPDDLLLEVEEQEYFFELLMRKASPERPKTGQPAENRDNPRDEAAVARGREKKRSKKKGKKASGKNKTEKEAGKQGRKEGATGQTSELEKQAALDLLNNPEAKGRGLVDGNREKKEQATGSQATSRGECSGRKMPDST
jgi:rubredoxin